MSMDINLIEHVTQEISAALGETQPGAIKQIKRIVQLQGIEWARALERELAQIEAQGGLRRPNGQRRTPGGAFLYLAYQRMKALRNQPSEDRRSPSGEDLRQRTRAPGATVSHTNEPLIWSERLEAVAEAAQEKGQIMTARIELTGRPVQAAQRNGTVVVVMEDTSQGTRPKTIPPLPTTPTRYTLYIAAGQWAPIEQALKNKDDVLIAEGYTAFDPEVPGITVFVTHATTKLIKMGGRRSRMNVSTPRPSTVSTPLPPTSYSPKQRVRHANFGAGEVIRTEIIDEVEKVTVVFDTAGLKRVLAATLELATDT